jgi:hypothetical protein
VDEGGGKGGYNQAQVKATQKAKDDEEWIWRFGGVDSRFQNRFSKLNI